VKRDSGLSRREFTKALFALPLAGGVIPYGETALAKEPVPITPPVDAPKDTASELGRDCQDPGLWVNGFCVGTPIDVTVRPCEDGPALFVLTAVVVRWRGYPSCVIEDSTLQVKLRWEGCTTSMQFSGYLRYETVSADGVRMLTMTSVNSGVL